MIDNNFETGMRVIMRKAHPCGSSEWVIVRTGADVKIKCAGCGRIVMLDRGDFMRAAVKLMEGDLRRTEDRNDG